MQLIVTLEFNSLKIPVAYRYMLQGVIYKGLSENPKYSSFMHNEGFTSDSRQYKLFTFGPLTGNYAICDKLIEFANDATFEIRSCNDGFIEILNSYFNNTNSIELGDKKIAVKLCRLDDRHILTDDVRIKAISPIVSYITKEDFHTEYFSPDEQAFYSMIKRNAGRKYASFGREANVDFEIIPIGKPYKKHVTTFKNTYITGYTGEYNIKGNPELLDFLYNTGIGAKNSQGFGMFEVI